MFELYGSSSQAMCFEWETKGKSGTVVRELCDNSRYNCSSYAEFTVLCVVKWEIFLVVLLMYRVFPNVDFEILDLRFIV